METAAAKGRAALKSAPPMRFGDRAGVWRVVATGSRGLSFSRCRGVTLREPHVGNQTTARTYRPLLFPANYL